jgi:hypothetical protein
VVGAAVGARSGVVENDGKGTIVETTTEPRAFRSVDPSAAPAAAGALSFASPRHTRDRPGVRQEGRQPMFRIRRFGVIRTANVVAFLYVVIVVVIFIPIGVIVAIAGSSSTFGGATGAFTGNAAGIAVLFFGLLAALFYGILGWIFTAIACLIYNFAARVVGGIEIQLEAVEPPPPPVVWSGSPTVAGSPATPPAEPPPAGPPAG